MYVPFQRPPRHSAPVPPQSEILLEAPPELPDAGGAALGQALTYLPMLAGGAAMSLMWVGPGTSNPMTYLASGMYGLSTAGMLVSSIGRGSGERRRKLDTTRRDYLRQLAQQRRRVGKAAAAQVEALTWAYPEPSALWSLAGGRRMWERRPADADFGHVRLGLATQRLAARLVPPETKPVDDLDPVCAGALYRFLAAHTAIPGLPVALSLRAFARLRLDGPTADVRALVRAVLAHLAVFHAPEDLRIAVCAAPERIRTWDWLKWLPHATHPDRMDGLGPIRLFATHLGEIERVLHDDIGRRPGHSADHEALADRPQLVVLLDGGETHAGSPLMAGRQGVTLLDVGAPGPGDTAVLRLEAGRAQLSVRDGQHTTELWVGVPDQLELPVAAALARQLSPYRLVHGEQPSDAHAGPVTFADLIGIGDPGSLDPAVAWRSRPLQDQLRVPLGLRADGAPLELDLKEAAQGGVGPHGMVIGATGSGKSELLRTLVLGLAATHSSHDLNVVLVDFKGGATFLGLERLPHTSAVITNLADELPLVDRMQDALHGELIRRQDLLRQHGQASRRDYERARELDAALPPLPSLLIVVDEFSELLANKPEFAELFVMIGRLGRSLGVHLLLASQHLDEGRLRGLGVHLSYRIALRTFSGAESRAVIGVASAYELPPVPGHAYLLYDNTTLVRFRAAYVSGPYHAPATVNSRAQRDTSNYVLDFRALPLAPLDAVAPEAAAATDEVETSSGETERSVLDVVVARLIGQGPPAHQVWLPPLAEPPALDDLIPEVGWPQRLRVPIGVVDRPFDQRREPLMVHLDGSGGNVAIVGKPQSGKSTALRTLIAALALTHTPDQVRCYCVDFGGGSLRGLADLPHVGAVAARRDEELVRRTVAELTALLERRERDFADQGIISIADARRGCWSRYPDVFLGVDNWLVLTQEFDTLEAPVAKLAARGLNYGIHVAVTANRWSEIRPATRDLLGSRIELRLGEPFESEVNRKAAANVPENVPGRGITKEALHVLVALPRFDGGGVQDLAQGQAGLVARIRAGWQGPTAPAIRTLPRLVPAESLPVARPGGLPIGLNEDDLEPVFLDDQAEPHLLVFGEPESGRTNLLRLFARQVVAAYEPEQARVLVVDYRRTLLDAVPDSHLVGYAASADAVRGMALEVAAAMAERLPGPGLSTEQLRTRSWWRGSRLFVLIDDYDLVEATSNNPLLPLVDLIGQGADIGLHLVLARAMGGAGRSAFETVMRRVREAASPGILLSGSPEEGVVLGQQRPRRMPPGRGVLVSRRHGTRTVQLGWAEP